MKTSFFVLALFFLHLKWDTALSQTLRVDLTAGLRTAHELQTIEFANSGHTYDGGSYVVETNVFFPVVNTTFGPFIAGHLQFDPTPKQSVQQLQAPWSGKKGSQVTAGGNYQFKLARAKIGVLGGIGYSWETFNVGHPTFGSLSLAHNRMVLVMGVNGYFPFFDFLEATISYKLTSKSSPHIVGQIHQTSYVLNGPSVFHTVSVGLSFPFASNDNAE